MPLVQVRPDVDQVTLPDGKTYWSLREVLLSNSDFSRLTLNQKKSLYLVDTQARLNTANLVYPVGLTVKESDTGYFKIPDGVKRYRLLSYTSTPVNNPTGSLTRADAGRMFVAKPSDQTPGRYAAVGPDGDSIVYVDPPGTGPNASYDGGQVAGDGSIDHPATGSSTVYDGGQVS